MAGEVDSRHTRIGVLQVCIRDGLRSRLGCQVGHEVVVSLVHRLALVVGRSTIDAVARFSHRQSATALADACRQFLMGL